MNSHRLKVFSIVALLLSGLMGFQFGFAGSVSAQASLTTLTPTPAGTWESASPGDYYFIGWYECPGPTSLILTSSAVMSFTCSTVRTRFFVELCDLPTGSTTVRGSFRTAGGGPPVPVTLTQIHPGSHYFGHDVTTPVMGAPVRYDVAVNNRYISAADIEYTCVGGTAGCPGSVHAQGEYLEPECSVSNALIELTSFTAGSECSEGPWAIEVDVVEECETSTTEGATVYAVFPTHDEIIGTLTASGDLMTDCTLTELPMAIGIYGIGPVKHVIARALCCDC